MSQEKSVLFPSASAVSLVVSLVLIVLIWGNKGKQLGDLPSSVSLPLTVICWLGTLPLIILSFLVGRDWCQTKPKSNKGIQPEFTSLLLTKNRHNIAKQSTRYNHPNGRLGKILGSLYPYSLPLSPIQLRAVLPLVCPSFL